MRLVKLIAACSMFQFFAGPTIAQESPVSLRTGPTTAELERRDQPVTGEDLAILVRADALLASEQVWNREDDRRCDDDESSGKRSLFCALRKACIEILGVYDHRRVAIQEVRIAIEDATGGQEFAHRLRDYNNLSTTRFDDVREVIKHAMERVNFRLASGDN